MRVLVTGGNGFIGRWVCEALDLVGDVPVVFDRARHAVAPYEQVIGDVRDRVAVKEAVAHVEGVIHLAAVLGTSETIDDPYPAIETNVLGAVNVMEAVAAYDVPMVMTGVGNHAMRSAGAGPYTITKSAAEDLARTYRAYRGAAISVVRPVNAYGPRQSIAAPYGSSKVRKIIPSFVCRALAGHPIEVYGDGSQVSDCVYVQDVARVLRETLHKSALLDDGFPEPIEVGPRDAEVVTVQDIARAVVAEVAKQTGRAPVEIRNVPMRRGEVPGVRVSADPARLTEYLAMTPERFAPLWFGIQRTVEWYREQWLPRWCEE